MTDTTKPITSLLDAIEVSLAHAGRYNAGDTAKVEELTTQRTTLMNASFLRASLFSSVIAFGVARLRAVHAWKRSAASDPSGARR